MATAWDRAAADYLATWAPRFIPYHADLLRELALRQGERVLVVSAGPGAEALAAMRAVDLEGFVRATDTSEEMVRLCREQMQLAGFDGAHYLRCEVADASDTTGGPWDAVVSAFGLWQLDADARALALRAWGESLSSGASGRIGLLVWGPSSGDDPFDRLFKALGDVEPGHARASRPDLADEASIRSLFEAAGLTVVRHAVVRHPVAFGTARSFVRAMREACTLRRVWEQIGDARMETVAQAFYDQIGGSEVPVSFEPPATLVIATRARHSRHSR